jgi:hypothetical protein
VKDGSKEQPPSFVESDFITPEDLARFFEESTQSLHFPIAPSALNAFGDRFLGLAAQEPVGFTAKQLRDSAQAAFADYGAPDWLLRGYTRIVWPRRRPGGVGVEALRNPGCRS